MTWTISLKARVDHDAEYEEVPDDGEVADDEFVAESNVVTDDTDDDSEPSTDEGLDEDTDADESPGEGLPGKMVIQCLRRKSGGDYR